MSMSVGPTRQVQTLPGVYSSASEFVGTHSFRRKAPFRYMTSRSGARHNLRMGFTNHTERSNNLIASVPFEAGAHESFLPG